MLPSRERFTRRQFSQTLTYKPLHIVYNKIGTLKYVSNPSQTRFSVVISAKNEKSAVQRNKLRRRIYTTITSQPTKVYGILFVSKGASKISFEELKTYIYDLVEKSKKNTK